MWCAASGRRARAPGARGLGRGDNANDLEMLREADRAFVIEPKVAGLARDTDATCIASFDDLATMIDDRPADRCAA
jgi:predicted mannosyl-3-phosphoglycerate phosphatase (HAD superfamily)